MKMMTMEEKMTRLSQRMANNQRRIDQFTQQQSELAQQIHEDKATFEMYRFLSDVKNGKVVPMNPTTGERITINWL